MAITKDEFKQAFREVMSAEFSHIPTDENSIDYTFSDKFERKMQKLIKAQKKSSWKFTNTTKKRVAILIAILIALLATACSVKQIREPVVTFFTETYDSFVEYFFEGDTVDEITYEYQLTYVPEGFEQTEVLQSPDSFTTYYKNAEGDLIDFTQMITAQNALSIDNENCEKMTFEVNGEKIEVFKWKTTWYAMWIEESYLLTLTCQGNFNIDMIQTMIASVE